MSMIFKPQVQEKPKQDYQKIKRMIHSCELDKESEPCKKLKEELNVSD